MRTRTKPGRTIKRPVLVILVCIAAAANCAPRSAGWQTPVFSVRDIDGKTVSSAELKGKVIIANFWATWCPPCRAEIPDFVEFYNRTKSKGLEIIGFSVDALTGGPATADEIRPFVRMNRMTYPVVIASVKIVGDFDPGDAIPATFIIDREGRIRHKQVGGIDLDSLEDWFRRLSAEK